jgi:hypothetical protein
MTKVQLLLKGVRLEERVCEPKIPVTASSACTLFEDAAIGRWGVLILLAVDGFSVDYNRNGLERRIRIEEHTPWTSSDCSAAK